MNNTVLQVPMSIELREKSEKAANKAGFSSLQEVVRIFLTRLSEGDVTVRFDTPEVKISAKNEKRYLKMIDDYKKGKNIVNNNTIEEFFDKLNK